MRFIEQRRKLSNRFRQCRIELTDLSWKVKRLRKELITLENGEKYLKMYRRVTGTIR